MSMSPDTWKFVKYAKDYGIYDDDGYLTGIKEKAPSPPEGKNDEEIKTYAEYVKMHNDAIRDGIKL